MSNQDRNSKKMSPETEAKIKKAFIAALQEIKDEEKDLQDMEQNQ